MKKTDWQAVASIAAYCTALYIEKSNGDGEIKRKFLHHMTTVCYRSAATLGKLGMASERKYWEITDHG